MGKVEDEKIKELDRSKYGIYVGEIGKTLTHICTVIVIYNIYFKQTKKTNNFYTLRLVTNNMTRESIKTNKGQHKTNITVV